MRDELLFRVLSDQYLYNSFVRGVGIFECLSPSQKIVYNQALSYVQRHERCLTDQEAELLFDKVFNIERISNDFTFDVVHEEIKREKMKFWILGVADDIESNKVDYEKVYKDLSILKDKLDISTPKGIIAGEQIREMVALETSKLHTDILKTNINALDAVLKGGFHKSELAFLIAPPGRGKSTFLLNLMYAFILQQKVTLFLSNELRAEAILSRLYRRILKIPRNEFVIDNNIYIEENIGKYFKYAKGMGVIHYAPVSQWGVGDIRSWVSAWEKHLGRPVDAVIVDYVDRLKMPWGEDNRLKIRALVDSLRDFAIEKDIFLGSATQTNRHGLNAPLVTEEFVSDSFAKIESADVVLSLSQSASEREGKKGRLTVLKNREYGGAGTIIDVKTNWDILEITSAEEGEE